MLFPTVDKQTTWAIIGLVFSGILQYLIKEYTDVHLLLYAFTGMVSSIVIGYLASFAFTEDLSQKKNYTLFALSKKPEEEKED